MTGKRWSRIGELYIITLGNSFFIARVYGFATHEDMASGTSGGKKKSKSKSKKKQYADWETELLKIPAKAPGRLTLI